ncbi:MAG: sigma-70 family RNA polymerase sigma factor [Dermatophilus congolensis]|nr:sigma-70 family RNA polymerase sigma factor [Dermatophilus congolensis]
MSSRHLPSARSDASPSAESLLVELRHAPSPEAAASLCERIVDLTLALADMVARSFQYRGIETDDLIQVARLGLMKAIRGYDPAWKCSFAAYAAPTISGEIKRHFRDQGWLVKPPRSVQELRGRMATEEQGLVNRLHRHPTTQEFATHLGVDVAAVTDAKIATRGFAAESLTEFDESQSLVEAAMSGHSDQGIVDRIALRIALQRLTEAQRRLLRWRFADDLTQTEIAVLIGASQMQVSRLLRKCVTDLRALMDTERELDGDSGRGSSMESAAGSTPDSRRCSRGRADAPNRHVSQRRRRFVELPAALAG